MIIINCDGSAGNDNKPSIELSSRKLGKFSRKLKVARSNSAEELYKTTVLIQNKEKIKKIKEK